MTDQQIKDKRPRWLFQGQIDHKWIQSSNLTRSEISFILHIQRLKYDAVAQEQTSVLLGPG